MKIIITESQYNFIRRLPAVEEELNKHLKRVDPTKFDTFQKYIEYLAKVTLMYLSDDLLMIDEYGDVFYKKLWNHIMYNLRGEIENVYNIGKPGSLYGI